VCTGGGYIRLRIRRFSDRGTTFKILSFLLDIEHSTFYTFVIGYVD
jgi:hypothetical protein